MIMKKLVLVMMLFMCGSSFLAIAQDPVKKNQPTTEKTDSTTTKPAKDEPQSNEPANEKPDSTQTSTQVAE